MAHQSKGKRMKRMNVVKVNTSVHSKFISYIHPSTKPAPASVGTRQLIVRCPSYESLELNRSPVDQRLLRLAFRVPSILALLTKGSLLTRESMEGVGRKRSILPHLDEKQTALHRHLRMLACCLWVKTNP